MWRYLFVVTQSKRIYKFELSKESRLKEGLRFRRPSTHESGGQGVGMKREIEDTTMSARTQTCSSSTEMESMLLDKIHIE